MRKVRIAGLAAVAAALLTQPAAACALRFAWTPWEPFHYRDRTGTMQGVDHDLVTEAMRRMGCSLTWEEVPRSRGQELLKEGRVDAVAGTSMTADRTEYALFSDRLRPGINVLFVRKGEAAAHGFTTLEELARSGFRLGVVLGSRYSQEYERLINDGSLADNLIPVGSSDLALQMLVRGRLDGFIEGRIVGRRLVRRENQTDAVEEHPMTIAAHDAFVMFSRRSVPPALVRRFNEALAEMEADGTLARILDQETS